MNAQMLNSGRGQNAPFTSAAGDYAKYGIATFPCSRETKAPLVRKPALFGKRASLKMAGQRKWRDLGANIGFWCGRANGVTVVDIDTVEDAVREWAVLKFGATPLIVKTGSGKTHLWYKHAGERRMIRPFGSEWPIDILGGGLVIAPPSVHALGGVYRFAQGSLADLPHLPVIKPGEIPLESLKSVSEHESNGSALLTEGKGLPLVRLMLGLAFVACQGVEGAADVEGAPKALEALLRRYRAGGADVLHDFSRWAKLDYGKATTIAELIEEARQAVLTFNATGYTGSKEWSFKHRGTDGEGGISFLSRSPNLLRLHFHTGWSFPAPVFDALAERFPNLHFVCQWRDIIIKGLRGHKEYNVPAWLQLPGRYERDYAKRLVYRQIETEVRGES